MMVHAKGYKIGLSPRVRGKQHKTNNYLISERSITACAGETFCDVFEHLLRWVYHRVCGGNRYQHIRLIGFSGLSPRVRGKRPLYSSCETVTRSITACAGET